MATILVLSSGGIAATTVASSLSREHALVLLHLDYGQEAAPAEHRALVAQMPFFPQARLMRLSMPHVLELNRGPVEHARPGVIHSPAATAAHSADRAIASGSLRGLFPVMLAVGLQTALRIGAEAVAAGVTRGPSAHLGLPEEAVSLRREFFHAYSSACDLLLGMNRAVRLETPLVDVTVAQAARLGMRLNAPLMHTWSCLASGLTPCQKCAGCRRRGAAFAEAGHADPREAVAAAM